MANSLADIRGRIHSKSETYFTLAYRQREPKAWRMFYGATDAIMDASMAATAFGKAVKSDPAIDLLVCYGFLQALYIQQDAVWTLSRSIGLEWHPNDDPKIKEIRDLRNRLTGHPAFAGEKQKSQRLSSAIIEYHDVRSSTFSGHIYFDKSTEQVSIHVPTILKDNEDRLAVQMLVIEAEMGDYPLLDIDRKAFYRWLRQGGLLLFALFSICSGSFEGNAVVVLHGGNETRYFVNEPRRPLLSPNVVPIKPPTNSPSSGRVWGHVDYCEEEPALSGVDGIIDGENWPIWRIVGKRFSGIAVADSGVVQDCLRFPKVAFLGRCSSLTVDISRPAPGNIGPLDFAAMLQLASIDQINGDGKASNHSSANGGYPFVVAQNLQEGVKHSDPYKMQRGALNALSLGAVLLAVYYAWRNM